MQLFLCGAFSGLGLTVPFASPRGWRNHCLPRASSPRGCGTGGCSSGDLCSARASVSSTDFAGSQMSTRICQGSSQRYQANWALMLAATRHGLCSLTSVPEVFPSPFNYWVFLSLRFVSTAAFSCPHQPVPQRAKYPCTTRALPTLPRAPLLATATSRSETSSCFLFPPRFCSQKQIPVLLSPHLSQQPVFPRKRELAALGVLQQGRGIWWVQGRGGQVLSPVGHSSFAALLHDCLLSFPSLNCYHCSLHLLFRLLSGLVCSLQTKFCHIPRQGSLSLQMPESMSKWLVYGPKHAGLSPG